MVRAIVLAAGASTRMGRPKPLLPDGCGRSFLTRLLHSFASAGVRDIVVVSGAVHQSLVAAVAADPPNGTTIRFARNPEPDRGQLSSLVTGLDRVDSAGVEAVLVTLVDVPFVQPATIRAVLDAFVRTRAPIVRPARGDRHGHPVLFARRLFGELRGADLRFGAKPVMRAHAAEIVNVEVDDFGALDDIDTPEEYNRSLGSGPQPEDS